MLFHHGPLGQYDQKSENRTKGQDIVIELAEDTLNPEALLEPLNDGV